MENFKAVESLGKLKLKRSKKKKKWDEVEAGDP